MSKSKRANMFPLPILGFLPCAVMFILGCSLLTIFNEPSSDAPDSATIEPVLDPTQPSHNQFLPRIQELMSTNEGCVLPCFWGLQPGESSELDVQNLIGRIDEDGVISEQAGEGPVYNFTLFFDPEGLLNIGFSTQDGRLIGTSVLITSSNSWLPESMFKLPDLLNELGTPDDILLQFASPPLGFTMVIVYNDAGVMVRYLADFNHPDLIPDDEPLPICLSSEVVTVSRIDVWLQNPEDSRLVEENQPGLRDAERDIRPFWPLQRAADMSMEEFTDFFIENPEGCIAALSIRELWEQGYRF